jgi:putative spermidine/putrescine transport system ATP-binding protein
MDEVLGFPHQEPRLSGADDGLVVDTIARSFAGQKAVDRVSFEVRPGELVALVGASGSGKTTTLRIVAGYEQPDSGRVLFGGQDITRLGPAKRGFGMVFQHYALFPHMSVIDNVAFGLEARGVRRAERRERAAAALERVGLSGKGERMVQQLSGGEQQRVALARAGVIDPRLLLLDEPLSNLDPTLRASTRDELRTTLKESGAPALFVTHDQDDAFAIADRIVLLSLGRVLQIGSPEDLYDRPASGQVAMFIGHATLVPARRNAESAVVRIDGVTHSVNLSSFAGVADGEMGAIILRPEAMQIIRDTTFGEPHDIWRATVMARRFAGAQFVYRLRLDHDIVLDVAAPDRIDVDQTVGVRVTRPVPMVP